MHEFRSEIGQNYGTYTFGYAEYARLEGKEPLGLVYEKGYLPYSGSSGEQAVFYRARSARVILSEFGLSSENRRIAKKFDGRFLRETVAPETLHHDAAFVALALRYFATLHGEHAMPSERLMHVLESPLLDSVVLYKDAGMPVAYVLRVGGTDFEHYWFSFYDVSFARQSLGMWLMLDCVRDAQTRGLSHYYLGTVYGEKALYKTNFVPLEWWDGEGWNKNTSTLKERARTDAERVLPGPDLWKQQRRSFA